MSTVSLISPREMVPAADVPKTIHIIMKIVKKMNYNKLICENHLYFLDFESQI